MLILADFKLQILVTITGLHVNSKGYFTTLYCDKKRYNSKYFYSYYLRPEMTKASQEEKKKIYKGRILNQI